MFTGIIEALGTVQNIVQSGTNFHFQIYSDLAPELKIDQSLAHNGVCLTVVEITENTYTVTAVDETLQKTNVSDWIVGTKINLERSMLMNGRIDGHIVQGHVDQIGICTDIMDVDGSWLYTFEYDANTGNLTVEKGSICVNGVSLTVFNSRKGMFSVAIIPYTYEHTNFHAIQKGDKVNLEFDILGKYVKAMLKLENIN